MTDQKLHDEIDKKVAFLDRKIEEFQSDHDHKKKSLSVYEKMPHLDARQQQHKEDLKLDIDAIEFNLKRYDIKRESLINTQGRLKALEYSIVTKAFDREQYPAYKETNKPLGDPNRISVEQIKNMARHDLAEVDHIWDIDKSYKADMIAEYDKQIEQGLAMIKAGDYDHSKPITDVVGLKHKTEIDQITDRVIDRMENRDKLYPLPDKTRDILEKLKEIRGLKNDRANDKAVQALGNNKDKIMSVNSYKNIIDNISSSRTSEPKTNEKEKSNKDISD